jgi:HTH-type transcriptional regulator/antitoxin HigA
MNVRPICTAKDHAWALKEIERLWDKAEPGTPEGERFDVLTTLVDAYERAHFPIPAPDPIEAILFRLDQQGLDTKVLLPVFKTRARLSEILTRRRRLSLAMIRELHGRFGIPLESLVGDYKLRRSAPAVRKNTDRTASRSAASNRRRIVQNVAERRRTG